MKNYVISSLGDMYMEEVTADDIRLALVPLSQKSKGLYDTVNMLIKCVFYSAERSQLITDNPCVGISAKGGKASKKKDALTDQQVAILLDTVKDEDVLKELQEIDVGNLTPIDALNTIYRLQSKLRNRWQA